MKMTLPFWTIWQMHSITKKNSSYYFYLSIFTNNDFILNIYQRKCKLKRFFFCVSLDQSEGNIIICFVQSTLSWSFSHWYSICHWISYGDLQSTVLHFIGSFICVSQLCIPKKKSYAYVRLTYFLHCLLLLLFSKCLLLH